MIRYWMLFITCLFVGVRAVAADAADAAQPEAMVIVVKDAGFSDKLAGLLKAESAATEVAPAVPEEPPLYEQFDDIWIQFSDWFVNQRLKLIVLGVGLVLTYLIAWLINWLLWNTLIRLSRKTKWEYDDLLCEKMRAPTMFLLCTIGIFLSSFSLFQSINASALTLWKRGFAAMVAVSVIWGVFRLIDVLDAFLQSLAQRDSSRLNGLLSDLIRKTLKVALLLLSVMFIGQNILGLNLTALLAGAGVAGLAIAFAAQDTLANFFGSITIILDRTFNVGDRVKMNAVDGIIESMGLRSTRIRALDGNLFSVPNRMFADNVLENVSSRPNIKYPFELGLVYETTAEQMQQAKSILMEILNRPDWFDLEKLPPRIWFTSFGAYSLNLSVIVWFNTQDFFLAQNWKEELNLEILRRFNAAGLGFAFPSQTIYTVPTGKNSNQ